MYGARISLLVGVASVLLSLLIGVSLGLLAGFVGGWTTPSSCASAT
jgi:peptide/nickel transport system permease protein